MKLAVLSILFVASLLNSDVIASRQHETKEAMLSDFAEALRDKDDLELATSEMAEEEDELESGEKDAEERDAQFEADASELEEADMMRDGHEKPMNSPWRTGNIWGRRRRYTRRRWSLRVDPRKAVTAVRLLGDAKRRHPHND